VHAGEVVNPFDIKDRIGVTLPANATDDVKKTAWSVGIINTYTPNFMLVHLAMLDHQEHEHSPFSPEANEAVEKLDQEVGQIIDAELKQDPKAKVVIVSDHGFVRVDHDVLVNVLLARAGLITLRSKDTSPVESWEAQAWISGGTAAIMLHNPSDEAVKAKVKQLLDTIAADPQYGINEILTHDQLIKRGGYPDAAFLIDFKLGWSAAAGFSGDAVKDAPSTGTHGYLPDHPELRSAFMVMGDGVAKGRDLGVIDMRQIAPSVASMLGVKLPAAKLHAVHYKP
jgi:predicted AlkP superfamily pyrophosphatase or phosphodiesterase